MRKVLLGALAAAALLSIAPSALATGPTTLGRTSWQVARPYQPVHTPFFSPHGAVEFYNYIPGPVPGADDPAWSNCGPGSPICPSADTIGMAQASRLSTPDSNNIAFTCLQSADYTFFQSLVSIPAGTTITQFTISMSGADDGARAAIYNSNYPNGQIVPGSYITLSGGTGSTSDLSSYVVPGEVNRVVITQVDDCAVENNLRFAQILLNGTVVPPKPADDAPPVDAPVITPAANGAGWNNTDVSVAWNWTDADSGIDPAHCQQSSSSTGEGAITLTSTCSDLAGNSASDSRTVYVDETAPADAPTVSPAANLAGWNNSDVSVAWNWSDGGSGIDPAQCVQSSTSTGEGAITLTSTCYDMAGNSSSDSATVKVDKTAPTITYTGNAGTYSLDQNVSITCTPSDALSGVASDTCSGASGPAWSFGGGIHPLAATATDNAGNVGSNSTSFTVTVDAAGLCGLVRQFEPNAGIANSLCVKLNAAAAAGARGQSKTKANVLGAFDAEVSAQTGKTITPEHADILHTFAAAL